LERCPAYVLGELATSADDMLGRRVDGGARGRAVVVVVRGKKCGVRRPA
jgi:hypothetical protein